MKHYVEKQCFREGRLSWVPIKDSTSESEQFSRGYYSSLTYISNMRDLKYRLVKEEGGNREVLSET